MVATNEVSSPPGVTRSPGVGVVSSTGRIEGSSLVGTVSAIMNWLTAFGGLGALIAAALVVLAFGLVPAVIAWGKGRPLAAWIVLGALCIVPTLVIGWIVVLGLGALVFVGGR